MKGRYFLFGGLVFFSVLPWLLSVLFGQEGNFYLHLLILIFLYGLLASAWNIIGGFAGQVSLGHAVYFGLGAYTSSVLLVRWGINPWLGMLAGALVAAAISIIIGYPIFRLKGHYFAITTIALGEVVLALFTKWEWVGGAVGLYLPLRPDSWLELQFKSKIPYYYIALTLLLSSVFVSFLLRNSRWGYFLLAIKNDQDAARALGIDPTRYKLLALSISAVLMAIGGTFYGQYVLYIDPESVFPLVLSIQVALTAILGGAGSLWGPVLGAFLLVPLSELSRAFLGGSGSGLDLVIYGSLIMLVALYQPAGLIGLWSGRKRNHQPANGGY